MAENPTEEKGPTISDEDRELILTAQEEFNKKNYNLSLQTLIKLESSIGSNLKLSHNKLVVEFYKNNLKKHDQFEKLLQGLVGQKEFSDDFEIKDVDLCPAYYNYALLLYHSRQPIAALKIMTAVFKYGDHLEENFIQKVYLLTLTMLLDTNQPKKAGALLELLENRLGITKEALISDEDDIVAVVEESIVVKPKEKERNIDDFKEMLKLCTIRVNLLNSKAILPIPFEDTSEHSILKGHQYYLGNDYQMAARELSKNFSNEPFSVVKNGEDQNTCLANNMGLIHFAVRHYAMAVRFFQHALTFDQNGTEIISKELISEIPLHCLGATKRPEILYNLGIAMLHLQRPKEAFECLLVPLNYHHNNPRLWLRLAEACIMVHRQNLKQKENYNIVSSVIGSGVQRKYVIRPTPPKYVSDDSQSFAIPSPNLEFASLCLRNALTLVDHFTNEMRSRSSEDEEENITEEWHKIREGIQSNPSKPLKQAAFEQLKCSVLAAYSYVLICLGEYTLSLKYGKELLLQPTLSDTHKMLGHLYCAECLIMMDRIPEALLYLDPKFIKDLNGEDFETRGSPDWNINSLDAAQSVLTYNLAVALVNQGDIELARSAISACKHPVVLNHLKILKFYIELQVGNIDNCRLMIRLDTPQYL